VGQDVDPAGSGGVQRATVVVLGAGRMGLPVIGHWVRAGFRVHAVDPDPQQRSAAWSSGARTVRACAGPETAVADVVVTVLPGAAEVGTEMLEHRTVDHVAPGAVWLDLTSGDPATTAEVARELAARSVGSVTAAMAGGVQAARSASLEFYVGGAQEAVTAVRPLLDVLAGSGGAVRPVGGDVGAGQLVKLLANLLWFGQAVAVTEVLLLGRAAGLDVPDLVGVLRTGAGGSAFLDRHAGALLTGDDLADFGLDRCVEELEVLERTADRVGSPFDLSGRVVDAYRAALERYGAVDGELLASRLLQERAGRRLHDPGPGPGPIA